MKLQKGLKDSESAAATKGDGGKGRAEGLHELKPVGRARAHATTQEIEDRFVDSEKKIKSGAFNGCQIPAILHALSTKTD